MDDGDGRESSEAEGERVKGDGEISAGQLQRGLAWRPLS